jgi:hypothetical protein
MLPVQSGTTQLARELIEEIERHGAAELAACCERLGIERMTWYLAVLPMRDQLIIHVQGRARELILSRLAASRHQFDRWLYASLTEITGQDLGRSDAVQWLLPLADIHGIEATRAE